MDTKVNYTVLQEPRVYALEGVWGAAYVFSRITLKDMIWLFSALMLERKIIFLSGECCHK